MKFKRGIFIGRFQPFHNGHLKALKKALTLADEIVILIGSSNKSYEVENPFTVGERIEMIQRTLVSEGLLSRCYTITVHDVMNNALWVANVNSLCPKYDVVFTNNPLTKALFQDAGKKVVELGFFERNDNDGTKIRNLMRKKKGWEEYVPKTVADFMREIKGVERIAKILNNDKE